MDETVAQYIVLVAFILALVAVVFPFDLKSRIFTRPIPINFVTGPLIAIFSLMLSSAVKSSIIIDGIVGDDQISPYTIILLFFSLAYVCISLDVTNIFAFLAIKVVEKGGRSGFRLFTAIYIFSSILTLFTSNDIVILTVTPIVCSLAIATGCDPTPLLLGQFYAANICSVALIIGNPTNVIAGEAYGLTFMEYLVMMMMPAVVSCITGYVVLVYMFRKRLNFEITNFTVDEAKYGLYNKRVTVFKCALFGLCLLSFALSDTLGMRLWVLCVISGIIYLVIDIVLDYNDMHGNPHVHSTVVVAVLRRLPYSVAPFMVSMFSLVYALEHSGWVSSIAEYLSSTSLTNNTTSALFFFAYLTGIACSLMNNQPTTIMFSRVLLHSSFNVSDSIRKASVMALIAGSNFGANYSYVGAMAGLMFLGILKHYGITLPGRTFSKFGLSAMMMVTAATCTVLSIEFIYM